MDKESYTEGFGAKALTFALIVGAAALFLEATWSPVIQGTPKTAVVQTIPATTAVETTRFARN